MTKIEDIDIETNKCASCHRSGNEVGLLEISLRNYIPRNLYCADCISILVDNSKSKNSGKAAQ